MFQDFQEMFQEFQQKNVSKSSFIPFVEINIFLIFVYLEVTKHQKTMHSRRAQIWSTKTGFVPEVHWPRTAAIYNVPERVNKQTVPPSIFHFTVLQLYCGANQQNYYTGRWHKHSNKIGTSRLINVSPICKPPSCFVTKTLRPIW